MKRLIRTIAFLGLLSINTLSLAGPRIQQANLTYLGMSTLPVVTGQCDTSSQNQTGAGMSYNPAGNGGAGSFILTGPLTSVCLTEIAIPTVGSTPAVLQAYDYDVLSGANYSIDADCGNGCYPGGHIIHNGSLYINVYSLYSSWQNNTQFSHSTTFSNNSGQTGPLRIGTTSDFQRALGGYIDQIPVEHQSKLGGAYVTGMGYQSVISSTSFGPGLAVYTPGSTTDPVVWLMRYDDANQSMPWAGNAEFPACTGAGNRCRWDTQTPGQPLANGTSSLGGMTFIEGSDTVAFVMTSGTGEVCYKESCTPAHADPGCNVPGDGHLAAPTKYILMFFDVDDLASVKNGTINPWDVSPYTAFSIANWAGQWEASCSDTHKINGIQFIRDSPNSATGKLYIYKGRNNSGQAHNPVMHIYSVSGLDTGGGGDTTSPTVSITSPSGGATVSGTTAINANCTDNVAVQSVQFKVDGTNYGSPDTSSPFTVNWDTTSHAEGSASLTAVCTDTSANSTTSAAVNVTVSNVGLTSQGRSCTGPTLTTSNFTSTRIVNVSNVTQLNNAIGSLQAGDTIVLADGTYNITSSLVVSQPNVTIMGNGPGCGGASIVGGGLNNASGATHIVWTDASNLSIAQLTMRDSYDNLFICNAGCSSPHLYNLNLYNSGSQFIKINGSNASKISGVLIEYNRFEYLSGAEPNDHGSGYGYYNGISAHGTDGMIVRDNVFYNLHVSDSCASNNCNNPSVLIWNGSINPVVERNLFVNVDQGISFGLVQRGSFNDMSGGIARNNVFYNSSNFWSSTRISGATNDGMIRTFESPNSKIYNNTIISNGSFGKCIVNRFSTSTGVLLRNNICDVAINSTDLGATATLNNNITNSTSALFTSQVTANFHLLSGATSVIDQGYDTIADVPQDYEKGTRSLPLDIGAYLYGAVPVANFTCSPLIVQAIGSTTCTDSSTNTPTSWAWSGGCGTSSTQNPSLTCSTGGRHNVCLIATNGSGSSTQFCRNSYVVTRARKPGNVRVGP